MRKNRSHLWQFGIIFGLFSLILSCFLPNNHVNAVAMPITDQEITTQANIIETTNADGLNIVTVEETSNTNSISQNNNNNFNTIDDDNYSGASANTNASISPIASPAISTAIEIGQVSSADAPPSMVDLTGKITTSFLINIVSAISGLEFIPEIDGQSYSITYSPNSGLLNMGSNIIASLTQIPVSGSYYAVHTAQKLGLDIATPVYAQGYGFSAMEGFLDVWRVFRNVAYIALTVVIIIVGIMIIFQQKLDGGLVVTVQQAIPKIILALILITFSYAIVGFLIDIMYLVIFMFTSLVKDFINYEQVLKIAGQGILGIFGYTYDISYQSLFSIPVIKNAWTVMAPLGAVAGGIFGALSSGDVWLAIVGGVIGGVIGGFLPSIIIALIIGLISLSIVWKIFKILAKSYVSLLLNIIFAPIILLGSAFPGSKQHIKWFKNIIANLAVFPTLVIMFCLANMLVSMNEIDLTARQEGDNLENAGEEVSDTFYEQAPEIDIQLNENNRGRTNESSTTTETVSSARSTSFIADNNDWQLIDSASAADSQTLQMPFLTGEGLVSANLIGAILAFCILLTTPEILEKVRSSLGAESSFLSGLGATAFGVFAGNRAVKGVGNLAKKGAGAVGNHVRGTIAGKLRGMQEGFESQRRHASTLTQSAINSDKISEETKEILSDARKKTEETVKRKFKRKYGTEIEQDALNQRVNDEMSKNRRLQRDIYKSFTEEERKEIRKNAKDASLERQRIAEAQYQAQYIGNRTPTRDILKSAVNSALPKFNNAAMAEYANILAEVKRITNSQHAPQALKGAANEWFNKYGKTLEGRTEWLNTEEEKRPTLKNIYESSGYVGPVNLG